MRLRCSAPRLASLAAIPLVGVGAGGAGAASDEALQLEVRGVDEHMSMCGKTVTAARVFHGERVRAQLRAARPEQMHRLRLVVDRCVIDTTRTDAASSRWTRVGVRRVRPSRRRVSVDTTEVGNYRVRALGRTRTGRIVRSGTVYVRVAYPTALTAEVLSSNPEARPTYGIFPYVNTGGTYIQGRVTSPSPDCVDERGLSVFRIRRDNNHQYVATGRSYSDGSYVIGIANTAEAAKDQYFVWAWPRGSCAAAESPVVSGR